ncbi:hypothetical protein LCGC14_3161550, partial [marine sediment metagenome]
MSEIPVIERIYEVILPSGQHGKVNVFDMNLATFCDDYVQLEDTSWIKARLLT